ncbi:hypothetical protein NMY22_g19084 [Coprinellus aureogranulatus]|nr:hypothetical protein NMY22_g19084 [Coprinellus aureogranulatus]
METAQFTEQQLADLEAGGIRLVNCIMAGGDSAAEFNQIFGEWVVGNGVPFPENMNPGAGWEEKWIAARNRLMVHLCHHGRAHLRKLDNRLLNYHLSDLIDSLASPTLALRR